ncbi:hypothetical protein BT96DRAFT_914247, partial [Gymnopus androsaceus JB14]
MSCFASLQELDIECPFLGTKFEQSLHILKTLCGSSLASFRLNLITVDPFTESQSPALVKVLEPIANCSNLLELDVMFPWQESSERCTVVPIQDVWDTPSFTFTFLKFCKLVFEAIEFECFLQRHPNVERLMYISPIDIRSELRPDLPKLSGFEGLICDFITLSLDARPHRL